MHEQTMAYAVMGKVECAICKIKKVTDLLFLTFYYAYFIMIQTTIISICFCHHFCKNQAKMPPKTLYIYFLRRILSVAKN